MASDPFAKALAYLQVDRPFEALTLLNEVIAAQPERAVAYGHRARIRRRLGDNEGAIADYTRQLKLSPTAEVYLARALSWLSLENAKGAIADAREAIALSPEFAGAHRLLGKALGLLGDGPAAIAAYKQAARCYIQEKDKANAQTCLEAIVPLQALPPLAPRSPDPQPNSPSDPASALEQCLSRAEQKYGAGSYAAALEELNWLLSVAPTHAQALCLRGLIQAQLGRREQAVADLALARQAHPEESLVRFYKGQMRLIFKDGYGAAEEFTALIEAATAAPQARYFIYRGHSWQLIGELDKAFRDYANAAALSPDDPQLYELQGDIQKKLGAVEEAIANYQRAATLWLDQGNWQKHQQVVEQVRSLRDPSGGKSQSLSGEKSQRQAWVVPIHIFERGLPVVEVLLDGLVRFEMVIDRNATHSVVTRAMANRLNLKPVSYRYVYLADGTPIELPIGCLRSVVVGTLVVSDVYVAIAPDDATPVLGKDCFSAYSIRISGNEITFLRGQGNL